MINKRLFLAGLTTGLLSLSVAFPAMAGSWKNGAGSTATRTASANATISTPKAGF